MGKDWKEIEEQLDNTGRIKKLTKDIIKNGSDLALKEYYKAESFERLKRGIMK